MLELLTVTHLLHKVNNTMHHTKKTEGERLPQAVQYRLSWYQKFSLRLRASSREGQCRVTCFKHSYGEPAACMMFELDFVQQQLQ